MKHWIHFFGKDDYRSIPLLSTIWMHLEQDKTIPILFYDGAIRNQSDFMRFLLNEHTTAFAEYIEGEPGMNPIPVSFAWLNGFEGRMARAHCAGFRHSIGRKRGSVETGKRMVRFMLTRKDSNGYFVDTLFVITPISNKVTIKFNERVGLQRIGILPNACYMADKGAAEDGVLTYVTRESMGLEPDYMEATEWEC